MTHPASIGGYAWNQVLAKGKQASQLGRNSLRRILDETPGPQTEAMLLARTALSFAEIENVLNELEEIGRKAKNINK